MASITKFLSLFVIVEVGINGSTRVALYKSLANNDKRQTSAIINANDRYYRRISMVLIFYVLALAFSIPMIVNSDISYWEIFVMVIIIGMSKFAENCWGINSRILIAASQTNYLTNITQTFATIANAVLLFLVVKFGGSVFGAKFGSSAILVLVPIILFLISHKLFHIDKKVAPDNSALKGRWDVLANSLSNIVHENVDVLFITLFCAATELSVYSVYYVVADGLTKVFQIITNGLEAGFGNMWARGEYDTLNRNLRQYEFIMYSLAALLFGCMAVLIVPFMSVYMQGISDANYIRISLGICIAIAQTLMSIRTPIIGTVVANAFRTIAYGVYVSKKMINRSFWEIVKRFVWMVVVFSASSAISHLLINFISIDGWASWILVAVTVFIIHAIVIVVGSLICYRDDLKNCISLFGRIFKRRKTVK